MKTLNKASGKESDLATLIELDQAPGAGRGRQDRFNQFGN